MNHHDGDNAALRRTCDRRTAPYGEDLGRPGLQSFVSVLNDELLPASATIGTRRCFGASTIRAQGA